MLEILYEDNHLIAVNKKAGEIVQGDKTGDEPLLERVKAYIKEKYNKPGAVFLGLIHRIDRPVSGVLLFAKTSKALARMNEAFKHREIQKTYWAVVANRPKKSTDTLTHYLIKNKEKNKSKAFSFQKPNSKEAILTYRVIGKSDNYHFISITPHTGRHHQIRVQFSSIGCSIKGDLKYGAPRSNSNASIHLHARKLIFKHPVKKEEEIQITAPVPDDVLWKLFENSVDLA